jgi:hypothetical protein
VETPTGSERDKIPLGLIIVAAVLLVIIIGAIKINSIGAILCSAPRGSFCALLASH